MSNDEQIRAFLAIEPPTAIRQEIGLIQARLKQSCPFDVRWVKPQGIHLTLKFLGDISPADVLTISRVAEKYTGTVPSLHFDICDLGVFPSGKHPRVLWIGLEGDILPLLTLQKNLETGLEECGFPRETRPFRPHLTLGRIKSARISGDAEPFMTRTGNWSAGSFDAAGLGVFQSDLTPQGAVYTRIAWFPFGG